MKHVLCIFSGKRKQLMKEIAAGQAPDTQLYGMNHVPSEYSVEVREFEDTWLGRLCGRWCGFRLRHALMYFFSRSADIVCGASIFYMLGWKRILGGKGKYVLLNISLNRFLNENARKPFVYKVYRSLLGGVDRIISLSHVQQDELHQKHNLPLEKLCYVPLGVDTTYYTPVYRGRTDYILAVGRDNGRDYGTVIEVAKRLPKREFHLVVSQRNLAGLGDIPSNVKIFFDISRSELRQKYAEAAILLLITHADGHSDGSDCSGQTVLLDAFASGLPVIASRKAYIADYARAGHDLLLVDFYSPSDIIEAIGRMPKVAETLARNARVRTEELFSSRLMGKHLGQVFQGLYTQS